MTLTRGGISGQSMTGTQSLNSRTLAWVHDMIGIELEPYYRPRGPIVEGDLYGVAPSGSFDEIDGESQ